MNPQSLISNLERSTGRLFIASIVHGIEYWIVAPTPKNNPSLRATAQVQFIDEAQREYLPDTAKRDFQCKIAAMFCNSKSHMNVNPMFFVVFKNEQSFGFKMMNLETIDISHSSLTIQKFT